MSLYRFIFWNLNGLLRTSISLITTKQYLPHCINIIFFFFYQKNSEFQFFLFLCREQKTSFCFKPTIFIFQNIFCVKKKKNRKREENKKKKLPNKKPECWRKTSSLARRVRPSFAWIFSTVKIPKGSNSEAKWPRA